LEVTKQGDSFLYSDENNSDALSRERIMLTAKSGLPLDLMLTMVFRYVSIGLDWDLSLVRVV
jgi:hypothetical protein